MASQNALDKGIHGNLSGNWVRRDRPYKKAIVVCQLHRPAASVRVQAHWGPGGIDMGVADTPTTSGGKHLTKPAPLSSGGKRRIQRRRQTDEEVQPPSGDQTTDCPLTSQRDRPTVSGLDQKIPPLLWCTPTTSSAPRNCESRTRPGRPMASCHHAKNVRQKVGSTKASLLGWGHCSASASRQSCPQHSHWRVSTSRTQPGAARSAGIRHKRVKSQAVFQSSAPSANANVTATITNPTTQLVA